MNYFISKKIDDFEKVRNNIEKCTKIKICLDFIIAYYAIVFYCHTKAEGKVSREIVNLINTSFNYSKGILISDWIRLLKFSWQLLGFSKEEFDNKMGRKIQNLANRYLPENNKREVDSPIKITDILDFINIIRNKIFAHTYAIPDSEANFLVKEGYSELPYKLTEFLESKNSSKLLLAENICQHMDDGQDYLCSFLDLSNHISQHIEIKKEDIIKPDEVYTNHLYCYFPKNKKMIPMAPFFIYRDKDYFLYDDRTNKGYPIYKSIFAEKCVDVKAYEYAFKVLIEDDIDMLTYQKYEVRYQLENDIYHNLPSPPYQRFIGRTDALNLIQKALQHKKIFLIAISGVGGVGKTAIAIKIARDLIESRQKLFSYIIWVSAKKTYLTPDGIITAKQVLYNLNHLLDIILEINGFNEDLDKTFSIKKDYCIELLGSDKFLLIVDNFETIENPEDFYDFFEEVGNECQDTKIIITTRQQLGQAERIIDLREFSKGEYFEFVEYLLKDKFSIADKPGREDVERLYKITGGLPLATDFIIGQCKDQKHLSQIVKKIEEQNIPKDKLLVFTYNDSFNLLKTEEQKILFAIALLDVATRESLCFVTELDEFTIDDILTKLKKYSLVYQEPKHGMDKYSILPLTKGFLIGKLEEPPNKDLLAILEKKVSEYKDLTVISPTERNIAATPIDMHESIAIRYAKRAYALAKQGDIKKSKDYFSKALSHGPHECYVWYYLAITERDIKGTYDEEHWRQAIDLAEGNIKLFMLNECGKTLFNLSAFDKCINIYQQIIKLDPQNKDIYHMLGKAYYERAKELRVEKRLNEMKNYNEKSAEYFRKSLFDNPKTSTERNSNVIAYYYLSKLAYYKGEIQSAKQYIDKAKELQPQNYRLHDWWIFLMNQ